jgi:hypothetical protein
MVASAIFNLIDLSPVKIDHNSAERLRNQNLRLLEKVREIEVYDEEDEVSNEEMLIAEDEVISNGQMSQELQDRLDSVERELLYQMEVIEKQVTSIEKSITEKVPYANRLTPEEYEKATAEEHERMKNLSSEEWNEEWDDWVPELNEMEQEDTFSNPEILRKELITVQQAERELLTLQKEIKRTFACENWENIAQGPFREQIFLSKIVNKEAWLDNEFISNRYNEHSFVMDNQLNSEIGNRYFEILSQITWDS